METIRVVLDEELLRATDRAARRAKVSRSAFVRAAIREHLRRLNVKELEPRGRRALQGCRVDPEEVADCE